MSRPPIHLSEFLIELSGETDGCYWPGDVVIGRVVAATEKSTTSVHMNGKEDEEADGGVLELVSIKLAFLGYGRLKVKSKAPETVKEMIYLNDDIEILKPMAVLKRRSEQLFDFKHRLRTNLRTSLESKSGAVYYYIRATCTYRTPENEIKTICAATGFTIVERFDLNLLPAHYFSPAPYNLTKKFGLFSCTGGHIRLQFSICRRAFVCGENITIEGRIENKTDRRVDKVTAVLQQVVMIIGNTKNIKEVELNIFDVCDVYEDNLALFVDESSTIKIDRNFALPPLPPSSFTLDGVDPVHLNKKTRASNGVAVAIASTTAHRRFSAFGTPNADNNNRFLKVLYQLSVRVKTGGTELIEANVPLMIGNVPRDELKTVNDTGPPSVDLWQNGRLDLPSEKGILYLQNRKERPISLVEPGFTYTSPKSQLSYANRYSYFVDLPTSSKQSRKVSALAHAVKNEASAAAMFRRTLAQASARPADGSADCSDKRSWEDPRSGEDDREKVPSLPQPTASEPTDSARSLVVLNVSKLAKRGSLATTSRQNFYAEHRPLSEDLAAAKESLRNPKGATVWYTTEQ